MQISDYLDQVRSAYSSGHATEHSYRPALYALFKSIDPALAVINEPKKSEAGMPDFLFQRGDIPVGWAEAKDIDKDVIKLKGYSIEQRRRYEAAYANLIYTNGVDFEFIREGQQVHFVSIADFVMGLQPRPENFGELERQLRLFAEQKPITVRSAAKLAEMMAAKAAVIKDEIALALRGDPEFRSGLGGQFKSFKANLLPALEPDEFADLYAETITYGMFAARFHDDHLATFSRQEAMEKLPASNPFLKGLFEYVAGPALPKRLAYIVDDLVQLMRASDPHSLFEDFGRFTARNDPFIHFYEDFLAAYNPKKRKSRGVWYTPEPVVDFIVRAVDEVLKTEFGLADGLADTSKVTVDWDTGTNHPKTGKPITQKRQAHRVQVLDPATGTGTFLAKAVQLIADRVKARAPGKWSGYVEQDLLPRLHGFELLMASYAMCHMKLDMQLTETGYKPSARPPRLSVWLTNALEPAERDVRDLFFQPLAEEARGSGEVKRQTPIMCVIGNPPYSGESANKGEWIKGLMEAYKREPGGKKRLKEKNSKWINKDEHKFLRLASHYVEKNDNGVLAFITSHGYLSDPTLRGMRWELLRVFDKIYVLDLHGNSNRKERAPDGSTDKNVFDIMQGVAIIVAVRKKYHSTSELADVLQKDLWGTRAGKNAALWETSIHSNDWVPVDIRSPNYVFVPRDQDKLTQYEMGVAINLLFLKSGNGIVTKRDQLCVQRSRVAVWETMLAFRDQPEAEVRRAYGIPADVRDWRYDWAKADVLAHFDPAYIQSINYRPFDQRFLLYTGNARGFVGWPVRQIMSSYLAGPNLGLLAPKANRDAAFAHAFVTERPSEAIFLSGTTGSNAMNLPLYFYPDASAQSDAFATGHRALNLDPKLFAAICKAGGIDSADQAGPEDDFRSATGDARPSEVKVFDYVYGVLHSPDYRATYAEFLRIDFPRIPYPASPEVFRDVSKKGEALRRLHLMEANVVGDTPYVFAGEGDDVVAAGYPKFVDGRVHINPNQGFDGVPEVTWNCFVGGYQPAQKWLKDRRGHPLSWDDIGHYQKIVKILTETARIMGEINLPLG
ncbi:type ISP restriction/modification enzyme [Devosia ginsengisoli]|uniref:site-specific DNA-methyltransferase (adenine-specific) n=1 Tax=Devosia ginsengisoli TaxID=400770 RepID=A0A5B8LV95_9HYPH|nr:type ISP restriction/modification enzyme [Devosia ginsengisoli]QDZ12278.1 DNA methyltransferase [Devosia ginsengisoli]